MKIKIISNSASETREVAKCFARFLINKKELLRQKTALIVSLEGQLGSGKTEFLKGIAQGLKLKEKIVSPTFIIMRRFPLTRGNFHFLWHIDCYRLTPYEFQSLPFKEIKNDPHNLVFIEWGDKVKKLLPVKHWWIKFGVKDKNKRILEFNI